MPELGDGPAIFRVVRCCACRRERLGRDRAVGAEVEGLVVGVRDGEVGQDNVVRYISITERKRCPADLGRLLPVVVDALEIFVEEELDTRCQLRIIYL